jgi:hypothetical protein
VALHLGPALVQQLWRTLQKTGHLGRIALLSVLVCLIVGILFLADVALKHNFLKSQPYRKASSGWRKLLLSAAGTRFRPTNPLDNATAAEKLFASIFAQAALRIPDNVVYAYHTRVYVKNFRADLCRQVQLHLVFRNWEFAPHSL